MKSKALELLESDVRSMAGRVECGIETPVNAALRLGVLIGRGNRAVPRGIKQSDIEQAFDEFRAACSKECDPSIRNLLYEWLHEGRFMVANTPEHSDLILRTRLALNNG